MRLVYFPGIRKFDRLGKLFWVLELANGLLAMVSYENYRTGTLVTFEF